MNTSPTPPLKCCEDCKTYGNDTASNDVFCSNHSCICHTPPVVEGEWENLEMKVEVVKGVEGNCLAINDYRVSGNKPWGGGAILHSFTMKAKDIPFITTLLHDEREKAFEEGRDIGMKADEVLREEGRAEGYKEGFDKACSLYQLPPR